MNEENIIFTGNIDVDLHSYKCDVEYFTIEPIDDLSFVMCSILTTNKSGTFPFCAMGELLGFAMRTGDDMIGRKIYRDEQEISLFKGMLKMLFEKRMITFDENDVHLTNLGRISFRTKCLYKFLRGEVNLFEFADIKSKMPIALKMFPLAKEAAIFSSIKYKGYFWPNDDNVEDILAYNPSQLAIRLNNLLETPLNIFDASQSELFDEIAKPMTFSLINTVKGYKLSVWSKEKVSTHATSLINEEINTGIRENIILKCRFQKLWNDKEASLDYETLNPFLTLVNVPKLAEDSRTVWSDKNIFDFIIKDTTPNTWLSLSRYCALSVIKENLPRISERINWRILSERIDESFLIANFKIYPWDLEAVSSSDYISDEGLKNLILQEKETTEDWDWDILVERLDEQFIKNNLRLVNCDLKKFTIDDTSTRKVISDFPEKLWDWNFIVTTFSEVFLIESFSQCYPYLKVEVVLDRIFSKPEYRDAALVSQTFIDTLSKIQKDGIQLATYSANQKNYAWELSLIELFTRLELIDWKSQDGYAGFDVNPYVNWNALLFEGFRSRLTSPKAKEHISASIKYPDVVLNAPDFEWNWKAISSNLTLINNDSFINASFEKLVWATVIQTTESLPFILSLSNLEAIVEKEKDAAHELSLRIELPFVISHPFWKWDWNVLTERMYGKIKLANLGHSAFVDKWDWHFLSANLPVEFINLNLETYAKYWDWGIVINRVVPSEKKLDPNYLMPFAKCLTNVSGPKCQEGWLAWTQLYSFKDLKQIILATKTMKSFWWDIDYFSSHPDFDMKSDLVACRRFLDWKSLKSSLSVTAQLTYDKSYNITTKVWNEMVDSILDDTSNKWDFCILSKQECFISNMHFIAKYSSKIDWKYISEHSNIFKIDDTQKFSALLHQFEDMIDWHILTSRADLPFTHGVYNEFKKRNWNLNAILSNGVFKLETTDIQERSDYSWNWKAISESKHIQLDSELVLDNLTQKWDWISLSHRDDIQWTPELINAIWKKKYEVDWFYIFSQKGIFINVDLIVELDAASYELNWSNISYSRHSLKLPQELYSRLDWNIIVKSKWFDINDLGLLEKCAKYINWRSICLREDFQPTIEVLRRFKDYLKWHTLCERDDFKIDNALLEEFSDYLDWNSVSRSESLIFSVELLEKYADRWNINELQRNRKFSNNRKSLGAYGVKSATDSFLSQFEVSTPKIYHFTHMSNAIKIIIEGCIQSRNAAEGHFDNSAGSNVHRTHKAHPFARFYFTTGTPTQFYNECMGKDIDSEYYQRACHNGLPKCPFPVFFVIELTEVLMKYPEISYYSNGNMQKDATKYFKVVENPDEIDGRGIYSSRNDEYTKAVKQQEFLIEKELQLYGLETLRIFCFDQEQCELLRTAVGDSPLKDRITYAFGAPFCRQNKRLSVDVTNDYVRISAPDFRGEYKFVVEAVESIQFNLIEGEDLQRVGGKARAHGFIKIPTNTPYRINLVTEYPSPRKWCLYDNTEYVYGK